MINVSVDSVDCKKTISRLKLGLDNEGLDTLNGLMRHLR